jgi:indolepyruvate ferredoxin oxidoreductase beta subunit
VKERFKILVVGVGGQGALSAARFLGEAALEKKLSVNVGQLHGMSQRGGSVEASVIIGPGHSSHIGNFEADIVLGLEPLEILRALPMINSDTQVVANTGQIVPFSLAIQGVPYPPVGETLQKVRAVTKHLVEIDGPALVKKVGVPLGRHKWRPYSSFDTEEQSPPERSDPLLRQHSLDHLLALGRRGRADALGQAEDQVLSQGEPVGVHHHVVAVLELAGLVGEPVDLLHELGQLAVEPFQLFVLGLVLPDGGGQAQPLAHRLELEPGAVPQTLGSPGLLLAAEDLPGGAVGGDHAGVG